MQDDPPVVIRQSQLPAGIVCFELAESDTYLVGHRVCQHRVSGEEIRESAAAKRAAGERGVHKVLPRASGNVP